MTFLFLTSARRSPIICLKCNFSGPLLLRVLSPHCFTCYRRGCAQSALRTLLTWLVTCLISLSFGTSCWDCSFSLQLVLLERKRRVVQGSFAPKDAIFSAMTQSLAALMQPWRNEAKAKLNSEEIFLLDHPTVQDQGFRAVLMPYSVKQRATLQALAQDECAQKVMAAVTKIEQKLQLLKAHGADFEAHKERYQVKILSTLAAQGEQFDLEQDADLYQTLRILEINSLVATQGSLGITATFLQSIAAYLELYPLCFFLHQMGVKGSDFSPEQMSDPVFDGLDEARKERIALFATVICDFESFTKSSLELVSLVDALLPTSADMKELATPLVGCALLGLDKSMQALHSLQSLQPHATMAELIAQLSDFCANNNPDHPALVRFNALVQSSAFARLKAKAQQLKPQLDDFELMDVGPKNKGPLYQAKKELSLTVAADELASLNDAASGATTPAPTQAPAQDSTAASAELSFAASATLSTSWGNPFAAPDPMTSAAAAPPQTSATTPSGTAAHAPGVKSDLSLSLASSLAASTMGLSTNAAAGAPRGLNLLNAASTDSAVGLGINNAASTPMSTASAQSSEQSELKPESAIKKRSVSCGTSALAVSSAIQASSGAKESTASKDSLGLTSAASAAGAVQLMTSTAPGGLSLSGAAASKLWSEPVQASNLGADSTGVATPAHQAQKSEPAAGLALTPASAQTLAQTPAEAQPHDDAEAATETEQAAAVAVAPHDATARDQAAEPTKSNAAPADSRAKSAHAAPAPAATAPTIQAASCADQSATETASVASAGLELTAASTAATSSMQSSDVGGGLALTPAIPEAVSKTSASSTPAPAAEAQGAQPAEPASLLEPSPAQASKGLSLGHSTRTHSTLSTSSDANLISDDASLGLSLAHADRFGLQLMSADQVSSSARSLEPTDQVSLSAGLNLTPANTISAIAPQGSAPAEATKVATATASAQTVVSQDRALSLTSSHAQSAEANSGTLSDNKSAAHLTEHANSSSAVSSAQQWGATSAERAAETETAPDQNHAAHLSATHSAVSSGAQTTASSDTSSNAPVSALSTSSLAGKGTAARDQGGLSLTNAAGDFSVRNSADAAQANPGAGNLGLSLSPADASTGLKLTSATDSEATADLAHKSGLSSGLEFAPASAAVSAESKSQPDTDAAAPAPSPAQPGSNTDQTTSTAPDSNVGTASAASSAAATDLEPSGARAQSASIITASESHHAPAAASGLALTSADSVQNHSTESGLAVQHGGLALTSAASSATEPSSGALSTSVTASGQTPAVAQATHVQTGELSLGTASSLERSPAFNALAASALSQQASAWDLLKPSTSDVGSAELLSIVTAAPTVTTQESGAAAHGTGTDATSQVHAESAGAQTRADSAVSDSKTAVASDASAKAASHAETTHSDTAANASAPENSALETSDNKPESSDFALASAEHTRGIRATSAHSDRSSNETVERANSIKHSTGRRHATESQERVWRQSDIGERRAQEAAPERWVSSTVRARYGASSAHARFDERVKIFSRKSDNTTTERTIGDIEQDQKQRLEAEMNSPEFQALRASRAAQYAAAQAAAEAAAAAENSSAPNPQDTATTSTTSGDSAQNQVQADSAQSKAPAKKAVRPVKYVAPTLEFTSATTAAAEQAPDLTRAGAAVLSSEQGLADQPAQSAVSSELSLGSPSSLDLTFSTAAQSTNAWTNFIAPSTGGLTIIGSDNPTAPSPTTATSASSAPISAADLWHSTVNAVKSAQQAAQARKNAQPVRTSQLGMANSQRSTKDESTASTSVAPARSSQRSKSKRASVPAQIESSSTVSQTNASVLASADEATLVLSGVSADSLAAAQTKAESATSADAGAQHTASIETPTHTPAATTQAKASEEKAAAVATQDSAAVSIATVSATGSASERTDSETVSAHSTSDTDSADSSSKRASAEAEGAPSTDDALSGGTVITTGSAESIAQLSPELQEAFAAASAAWDLSGESTESTKHRNKSKSAQTDDSSRSDELDTSGAPELNAASPASDTPDTTCDSSTAERESDAEEDQVPWLTSDTDSKVSTQSNGTSIPEVQSSAAESKAKPKRGRKSKAKAASSTEAASENTEANSARTTESADAEGKAKRRRSPTKAKKQVAVAEDLSDIEQKLTSGASSNLNSQERAQINAAAAAALFGGSDAASAESVAPSDAASSADSEREMAERVKLGRERRRKAAQGRMVLQELRTVLRTHKRSDQEIPTDEQFDQLSEAEQAKVMVQAKVLLNSLLKELGYRAPPQAKLLAELAQLDPESNASEELSGTPHDEPSSDDARGTEVALQRENQGFTQVAAAYDALAQTDYQPLKLDHAKLEQIAPDFYDHMGDEGVATEELSPEMRAILNKQQDQHALSKLRRFAREVNSELSKQNARANKKQAGLTESEVAAQGVSSKRELTPEEIVRARAQEVRRYIKTGYTEHDHLSAHELKATEVKASALTPDAQRQALQGASAPPKTTHTESQQDSADLLRSAQAAHSPEEVELPWEEEAKAADGTPSRSMRQATSVPELSLEQVLLSRPELIELEYHLLYGNYFRLSQEQYLELLDEPSAQLKTQGQLSSAAVSDLVHADRHQSLLIAELRPFRELNVMRRVLLELSDQQGDEQRLLRLQRGKFNYYLRLLGRNFFLTANARRVKGDLDPDLERLTNLSAQRNDDEVKFVLATILLTGAGLYLKSEASPLADTYRSLNFAPPC